MLSELIKLIEESSIDRGILMVLTILALIFLPSILVKCHGQIATTNSSISEYDEFSDTTKFRMVLALSKAHYDKGELKEAVSQLQQLKPILQSGSDLQRGTRTNLLGSCYLRLGKRDSAKIYLESTVRNLSVDVYPEEYSYAISFLAMIQEDVGNLTQSVSLYKEAIQTMEMGSDSFRLAATINNLGLVYDTQGDFQAALDQYYRSLSIFSALNVDRAIPSISTNIGKIHYSLENLDDALIYFRKALKISRALNISSSQANALNSIGAIHLDRNELDSAEHYLMTSLKISESLDDDGKMSQAKNNISKIYKSRKQYERAIALNNQALEHARSAKLMRPEIYALYELGRNYELIEDRNSALKNYKRALAIAEEYGDVYLIYNIQHGFYEFHKGHNASKALYFFERMAVNKDSIINKENLKEITKREMQYQFDKEKLVNDQKIEKIEAESQLKTLKNQQQRLFIIALLLISTLIFGLLALYLNRIRVQKELIAKSELLQKTEIEQLRKEKKILGMNAMIEGQEAERSRIAKDLHDGLGGLLATVKAHFSNIQSKIQKIEKVNVYNRANEMMDEACDEVRRISHNLMPGALRLEGLSTAVEHLGEEMDEAHPFSVKVETIGFKDRMEESKEVFVYRIIQEALNNIIKHSDATNVLIQLSETDHEYHFIVEDDGKGFDLLNIESGLGLKSIQSRVDFLKGNLDVDTKEGIGTTLSWYIPK